MTTLTRRLFIHGRVQRVGFRYALYMEAVALQVRGWVRNRSDGSVEALVCGAPEAVEALTLWVHRGPSHARVDRVLCNDEPGAGNYAELGGFDQRATL